MIGSKGHAAGAKCRRGRSHKRKQAPEGDRQGFAWVSGSDNGGSGVGGELDGAGDGKFFGVRVSSSIVEIKKYLGKRNFYKTVKAEELVAAIIHDVARVHVNPNCPENRLNIREVELRIVREAEIEHPPIGKRFLVEFVERHPLETKDLDNDQFEVLKDQIVLQGHQCFLELKTTITGDREQHVQGRQRWDLDLIPRPLPEDDCAQAWKDKLAEVVAELAPSNGKLLDTKGEAAKSALITFLKFQLHKLEPAQKQSDGPKDMIDVKDGDLFMNRHMPQSQWTDIDALQARYNN